MAIKTGMEIHGVCQLFDALPLKDVASSNTLIMGYGMCGTIDTAISLFKSLTHGTHDHVTCDSITYIAVLSVCRHGGLVDLVRKYLAELKVHKTEPKQMH
ncbi:hypothetical protein L1987_06192 [Smallanthus sonchifolius]|uniref:Uncharacterized protein n=1 Tax=Smallanthus sonchifolius TaxID=185202 RepID=A0ACB9JXG4_9ASTR|nr:hypothetical protein L1987_06192 [Smallanthus sonchifolius]